MRNNLKEVNRPLELLVLELWPLLQIPPPMFKTSHLGVSKFGFLSLCLFRTENPNKMPILLLTQKLKLSHFGNGVVLKSRVKLALRRIFCTEEAK
jgi:hypothetical protein